MLKDIGAKKILGIFLGVWATLGIFYGFLAYRFLNQSPTFFISETVHKAETKELTTVGKIISLTPEGPTKFSQIEKGHKVFVKYRCAICHGINGKGAIKNPNSQTGEEVPSLTYVAEGFTKQELEKKIQDGVHKIAKKNPKGQEPPLLMPSWKDKIKTDDANDLIEYLISLMPAKTKEEEW